MKTMEKRFQESLRIADGMLSPCVTESSTRGPLWDNSVWLDL